MQLAEIRELLEGRSRAAVAALCHRADLVRREHVGDAVHFRGLIEISNICARSCLYCGIRRPNRALLRYRMSEQEIVAAAVKAKRLGFGTVVLQSGFVPELDVEKTAQLVRAIKAQTGLAVTLSLGEHSREALAAWRQAGADRYLLRFETSNAALFAAVHPALPDERVNRFAVLEWLRELDYEVGSGVMVGLPGQTLDDLARDVALFAELELDMIGVGPFVPHPQTPLGEQAARPPDPAQATADVLTTLRTVALARLVCPRANIASTTALARVDPVNGRERGLQSGANVVMPNLTPARYRALYEIYPGKASVGDKVHRSCHDLVRRVRAIGREVGRGPGPSGVHLKGST